MFSLLHCATCGQSNLTKQLIYVIIYLSKRKGSLLQDTHKIKPIGEGILKYKYEEEVTSSKMTSYAGLASYLDFIKVLGLCDSILRHVKLPGRRSCHSITKMILSLIILNLIGGDCVSDVSLMADDEGLVDFLEHAYKKLLTDSECAEKDDEQKERVIPSESSFFRLLAWFHNEEEEAKRKPHEAFIPSSNEALEGLNKVIADFVEQVAKRRKQTHITIDADATLVKCYKKQALRCYKGYKAYQPFNFYLAELGMVGYTEFRDGNVPAGSGQLPAFEKTLSLLPDCLETVSFRADSASYDLPLLKYCARGKNPRFGVIEFAVGADVSNSLRTEILKVEEWKWRPLASKKNKSDKSNPAQEWALIDFVPNNLCDTKKDEGISYIAIRERLNRTKQREKDSRQLSFPFAVARMGDHQRNYKISAIVTNRKGPGDAIIHWHRERCGADEHSHSELKCGLAGGQFPSGDFGENAAWWSCVILAYNLNQAFKLLALPEDWLPRRIKAIRNQVIAVPGRIVKRGREVFIRFPTRGTLGELLSFICQKIAQIVPCPRVI